MNIVLASNNKGKIKEFNAILANMGISITTQNELNVPEIDEPYTTFIENALHKARHCSKVTGLPALADDSGLCVPSLHGQPGIYSARYAGENPKSDVANNQKLITELNQLGDVNRSAYFYCTLVFIRYHDDPQPIIADGILHGEIINNARGTGGFGYNPHFYIPKYNKTVAELDEIVKNQISHRGLALQELITKMKNAFIFK